MLDSMTTTLHNLLIFCNNFLAKHVVVDKFDNLGIFRPYHKKLRIIDVGLL